MSVPLQAKQLSKSRIRDVSDHSASTFPKAMTISLTERSGGPGGGGRRRSIGHRSPEAALAGSSSCNTKLCRRSTSRAPPAATDESAHLQKPPSPHGRKQFPRMSKAAWPMKVMAWKRAQSKQTAVTTCHPHPGRRYRITKAARNPTVLLSCRLAAWRPRCGRK
jgi:hypothetical protein